MSADNSTCVNCGKGEEESRNLKACTACKMVKYCNRECQVAHRPQHKKACKKRAAELHDEALFKDPSPPEDCPICFLPMPISQKQQHFKSCCGKVICDGCDFAGAAKDYERGKKKEDIGLCPFCRTPAARSGEEVVERNKKLMERGNADAYSQLAGYYSTGSNGVWLTRSNGVPQDYTKANDLFLKGGELGCAGAYCNLGLSYYHGYGVDVDKKKAKYFYELAAMGGDVDARHKLGCMEGQAGKEQRAYKHMVIAAKSGDQASLEKVKEGFKDGLVTKDEYAQALRAYHERQLEMKSEARDEAAKYREFEQNRLRDNSVSQY